MPANMKKAGKKYMYGGMKKKKMSKGGSLKPVPSGNKGKGLSKLPKAVRNKMGYKQAGGGIKMDDLIRKKPINTRMDSVNAVIYQDKRNQDALNRMEQGLLGDKGFKKYKEYEKASKKVGPLDQKTIDRINREEEEKMMYGGSKIKKMKPYMYGGKKVPGMFEDDRMMYGGMKKKRMQAGAETRIEDTVRAEENVVASKSNKAPNWNKKLNRLTEKRSKRKDKGKSTKRVQKRINKEYKKINP